MPFQGPEHEHALYMALKAILAEDVEPLIERVAAIERALSRDSDGRQVTELERAVDQLQRRLERAEEELRSSRVDMVKHAQSLQNLQATVDDIENLDGLPEKIATVEAELMELKRLPPRLDELESQMGQQAIALTGMRRAIKDVANEVEDLEKGYAEKCKQMDLAMVDFQRELDQLQRESSKTIHDQEVLTESHWTLNSTVITVQRELHELKRAREAVLAGTTAAMTELERKVDELRKEVDRALSGVQEELQQHHKDIEGTRADCDAAVARMQREVDRTLAGIRQDIGELKLQSETDVAGLQHEVSELRKNTDRALADVQQIASIQREVMDLRKQTDRTIVDVQQDVQELKTRLDPAVAEVQREVAGMQREMVDLRKHADRALANLLREVHDLRKQSDPTVVDLQREVADLRKQADRTLLTLQDNVQVIRDIRSQPDPAVADLQREVADLRKQADRTLLTLQDNVQVIRDIRSQPDAKVANLQRDVEDLRNRVDRVDVQLISEQRIVSDPVATDVRRQVDDFVVRFNRELDNIKRESGGGRDNSGFVQSLQAEAARLQGQLEQQLTSTAEKLERQLAAALNSAGGGGGGQVDQRLVRELRANLDDRASVNQLNMLASEIQLELRDLHRDIAAELRQLGALLNTKVSHRELEIALAKLRAEFVIPEGAS